MEKAGAGNKTGWATAACVWYIVVLLMGIAGLSGAYVTVLIVVYLVIITALMIQARNMDKAGYALEPVPSKTSDLALGSIYLGIIVIGIAVCGLFFTRLPMEWQERSGAGRSTEVSRQAEEQLKALGMPENVLSDLGDEDLSLLWGADRIIVQELPENADNDPVLGGLLLTHVAVRVPGDGTHYEYKWRFIHHFMLPGEQRFAGIETVKVDALCKVVNSRGQLIDNGVTELSGRVLMDKAGSICEAPYYGRTLGRIVFDDEDYSRPGWNILSLDRTLFSLECSFPRKTENARGYIMYAADFYSEGAAYCSDIEYWHNKGHYYPLADPAAPHDTVIPGYAYMNRSEQVRISTGE